MKKALLPPPIPAARTGSTTLLHAWSTVAAVVAPVTAGLAAPVDAVRDRRYGVTRRALHTRGERCTLEPLLAGPVHTHNTRNAKLANFTRAKLPAPAACSQGAGARLTLRAQLRVRYLAGGPVAAFRRRQGPSRGLDSDGVERRRWAACCSACGCGDGRARCSLGLPRPRAHAGVARDASVRLRGGARVAAGPAVALVRSKGGALLRSRGERARWLLPWSSGPR